MFTKRHFKAVANLISNLRDDTSGTIQTAALVKALCVHFKTDNPNFNETKFIEACKKE